MPPRFFSDTPITSDAVSLHGTEYHHLAKVLRLSVGDSVTLFDGSGFEFAASIQTIGRKTAELRVAEKRSVDRELPFRVTLAVALPKGDRQQWLIEKAVELGVRAVCPLLTDRGVAQPRDKALQRLEKWVISASKQSGRNRLMEIEAPQSATVFFQNHSAVVPHPGPGGTKFTEFLQQNVEPGERFVAIGPEGGFTEAEVATAKSSGCSIVNLGSRILRTETAAIAVVAGLIYTG